MNVFKSIAKFVTDPIGAVVICAGGGVGLWYFTGSMAVEPPKAAVRLAEKVVERKFEDPVRVDAEGGPSTAAKPGLSRTSPARQPSSERRQNAVQTAFDDAKSEDAPKAGEEEKDSGDSATEVAVAKELNPPSEADRKASPAPRTQGAPTSTKEMGSIEGSRGTSSSPENVLERRGLTKNGVYFVIAREAEILKAYEHIKPICVVMEGAYNQFVAGQHRAPVEPSDGPGRDGLVSPGGPLSSSSAAGAYGPHFVAPSGILAELDRDV
jgi:hypothetical protein